jgi:predicted transposase YbfD/YdcC
MWSRAGAAEQRLVLAQATVDDKTTASTAIPAVLAALAVAGGLVTLDARGGQRAIAQQVRDQGGDSVLALKDNQPQPALAAAIQECFAQAQASAFADVEHDLHRSVDKGHGRLEIRQQWVISDPHVRAWVHAAHAWPGLAAIGLVQTEHRPAEATTSGTRSSLGSRPLSAQRLGEALRSHWGVENPVPWVLDVTVREDQRRIRQGAAAENAAIVRRSALTVVRHHPAKRSSLTARRLIAGWNDAYLLQLLLGR